MGHEVDWSKFPKPWNKLGPILQARVAEDTQRIVAGLLPNPVNASLQIGPAHRATYAPHF